ncbi:hypothetical protein U2F26_34350 [Micromonospora sp. 4G57]|uniref:Uncharacterized protein n=1 Tax=Micromonospora sicca TaxID=2202420 RepID=A0ABU5JP46_9ACTN|nr:MULTISPECIES: hypothetical protein [unclassified Micromonospora]MDZ5447731.1 hypothetical protein [Micromonospora sp. 4G57]MDZ5494422.1 hypothetical protein [Micromonospora sp. 4G53]
MSSPPPQSAPENKRRRLGWALAVVTALLLLCGLPLEFARHSHRNESREADKEVGQYLILIQGRDHASADAMLCGGDDTSVAKLPGRYQPDWQLPLVESFTIVSTWDWSSVIDGHGRGYQVRLVFAEGSATTVELAVEVIADDPCIATEIPF